MEKNERWDILEAIIEIRFSSTIPGSALVGLIFDKIKHKYDGPIDLPILQIPENIRKTDLSLKFKPYYQFKNEDYSIEIGPDVLIMRNQPFENGREYAGWKKILPEFEKLLDIINSLKIISNCERIGIRYINFFKINIFDQINFKIDTCDIKPNKQFLKFQYSEEGFDNQTTLSNNANVSIADKIYNGSVIDMDTYLEDEINPETILSSVDKGHTLTRGLLLKKILKKAYVDSTNR